MGLMAQYLCTVNNNEDDNIRLSAINDELDEKMMRWLELSEIPD